MSTSSLLSLAIKYAVVEVIDRTANYLSKKIKNKQKKKSDMQQQYLKQLMVAVKDRVDSSLKEDGIFVDTKSEYIEKE